MNINNHLNQTQQRAVHDITSVLSQPHHTPPSLITTYYSEFYGLAELCLLMPTLAKLSQQKRWILLLNPPSRPLAAAWQAYGVNTDHLLMLSTPIKEHTTEQLIEKALNNGNYSAILAWSNNSHPLNMPQLETKARCSNTPVWRFSPTAQALLIQ